ncbi:MAG TPA: hypothetical protein VF114_05385 [Candidatus Limnocylindria bacterium]
MHALGQALSLISLIAGALEYAILLRHREDARRLAREREAAADIGLHGLVRVLLAEPGGDATGTASRGAS